jgi:hypothetical protein
VSSSNLPIDVWLEATLRPVQLLSKIRLVLFLVILQSDLPAFAQQAVSEKAIFTTVELPFAGIRDVRPAR